MKTTIEALQDIYVAKGGALSDVENLVTIPDMLEAISEIEETAEPSIPVSSDTIDDIIENVE